MHQQPDDAPIVSVVMAAQNAADFVGAAMAAVLAQSMSDFELIVVDDGSTDDTLAIAQGAARRDPRVKLLSSARPRGPAAARNLAFDAARGQWLAIVDADDLIHPRRLEFLLAEAGDADVVADDLIRFGAQNGERLLEDLRLDAAWRPDACDLLAAELAEPSVPVGYLKPMMRASVVSGLRYKEDMTVGEDMDLLIRVALMGARFKILPRAYYLYRRHPSSISHRLSVEDVAGMAAAAAEISARADVTGKMQALVGQWCQDIDRKYAFARLMADLKSSRILAACYALFQAPALWNPLIKAVTEGLSRRIRSKGNSKTAHELSLPRDADASTPEAAAQIVTLSGDGTSRLVVEGRAGLDALGYVPGWTEADLVEPGGGWSAQEASIIAALPWPVSTRSKTIAQGRVHVRTPTYRRPDTLRRALMSLVDQTHEDWLCDVFDDDPAGSAFEVVRDVADHRIRYNHVGARLFAAGNINRCFSRDNRHGAEYFCMLDDDSVLMPTYLSENIAVAQRNRVEVVFRNQRVEYDFGTPQARLSDGGMLDKRLTERVYAPDHFRLAMIADVGVSNGGLFWSHRAKSDLQAREPCSATLQEYRRAAAITDPVFVAMKPLRTWADNGSRTGRMEGEKASWLQRELTLKASVAKLRRQIWRNTPPGLRAEFLEDDAFRYPRAERARGLVQSGLQVPVSDALTPLVTMRLAVRGLLVRVFGHAHLKSAGLFARWK